MRQESVSSDRYICHEKHCKESSKGRNWWRRRGGYGRQFYQIGADQTLTDGDPPLLSYSYNAVYDEEGTYTGKGVTEYFYGGQEIDESSYDEMLDILR